MKIIIPDDYNNLVSTLDCFQKLATHEVKLYHDSEKDPAILSARFADAEVLVLIRERTPITKELLNRLPKLKFIAQTGRGAPHIDLAACTEHGIPVAFGGGNPYATAELTWALILASVRHIPEEVAALRAGRWITTFGTGLRGRTLGIFGYGKIGRVVAGYGQAFGMNVITWGREGSQDRARADGVTVANDQQDLFERADIVSIHVKLTKETRGIVTKANLAGMKLTGLLVNTSRADLIEPDALFNALQSGRPGSAAVDVFSTEPAINDPLLSLPNVLATPHIGYVEKDSYEGFFGTAFDQVLAFDAGLPVDLLNPEVLR